MWYSGISSMCVSISSTDHWRLNWSWRRRWRRPTSGSFRRHFPAESTRPGRPRLGDALAEAAVGAADDDDDEGAAVVVVVRAETTTPTLSKGRHLWSKTFRQPLLRLRPLRLHHHRRRHLVVALCCDAISLSRSGTIPIAQHFHESDIVKHIDPGFSIRPFRLQYFLYSSY